MESSLGLDLFLARILNMPEFASRMDHPFVRSPLLPFEQVEDLMGSQGGPSRLRWLEEVAKLFLDETLFDYVVLGDHRRFPRSAQGWRARLEQTPAVHVPRTRTAVVCNSSADIELIPTCKPLKSRPPTLSSWEDLFHASSR